MILVSYYCDPPGTTYFSEAAETMEAACERFGIDYFISKLARTGSWRKNLSLKPAFIREMVYEHGPVLWVDVDCPLHGNPLTIAAMSLRDHDVALLPAKTPGGASHPGVTMPHDLTMMDFIHGWANTGPSLKLLDEWVRRTKRDWKKVQVHRILQESVAAVHTDVDVQWLPETITSIVSLGRCPGKLKTGFKG